MEDKKVDSKDKMEVEEDKKDQEKKDEINQLEQIMYSTKLGDLNYDESLALAENLKKEGNELFQNNKFLEALDKYTEAINLKVETKNNSIYYSNRALTNLKLENYGSAIEDANMALKIDPNFAKAVNRRADAYIALNKLVVGFDSTISFLGSSFSSLSSSSTSNNFLGLNSSSNLNLTSSNVKL